MTTMSIFVSNFSPSIHTKKPMFLPLRSSSFSSPPSQHPPSSTTHLTAEYLVTSCGLSSANATKISSTIPKRTSTSQPDSVLHFLKHHGFTDANIRSIISSYPRILSSDVNQTLQPNLRSIADDLGFTAPELKQLITSNPTALVRPSAIPRLKFWLFLLNNNRKDLLSAFKGNRGLINHDIDNQIIPKIALLKERGLSDTDIVMIMKRGHRFITRSTDSIELLLAKATELGFSCESKMFVHALSFLSAISSVTFGAKMELFKSFGWSEEEFLAAFQKAPSIISYSEENIREKMEFLVGKAGCTQSYIISHPSILMYSLEKRLKPRCHVMTVLKANKLGGKEWALACIVMLSQKKFVERFVLPYEHKLPELHETYIAASGGKVLV